jgi:xylan 1,4-beta-xylosidase
MGAPLNLTRPQTEDLRRIADGLQVHTLTASDDGTLELDLDLPPWAVTSVVELGPATVDIEHSNARAQ